MGDGCVQALESYRFLSLSHLTEEKRKEKRKKEEEKREETSEVRRSRAIVFL